MPKKSAPVKSYRIKLVKSAIGYSETHKRTIRALGLRRMNQEVEHLDTPSLWGMLRKVAHLVHVEEKVEK